MTGCGRKDQGNKSTPTTGSLAVFTSSSITSVIQQGADQFNRQYVNANVNVYTLDSRAIVDSIINRKADIGYFDRVLSKEESLAVVQSRKHVYSFLLGTTVATWIVNPGNSVIAIDSLQLLKILTGEITTWDAVGGPKEKINVYLPSIGDGAWSVMELYFGHALTKVEGHYWPADSLVILRVAEDANGFGLVGRQLDDARVKRLKWRHPLMANPIPANVGSLQQGTYPFKVGLYYYTIADRTDLASGFLSFMAANLGQRIIADNGFLPGMVPVRIVNLAPQGDQK